MPNRRSFVFSLTLPFVSTLYAAQQPRRQPAARDYIKILEDPHRLEKLNPADIIRKLEIRPGHVVADIGSGSGVFTRPMARAVQPGGHVYAVDIDPDLLRHVQQTSRAAGIVNITTVLAPEDTPALRPGSLDLALICDTLHHIEKRPEYLVNLRSCMKPGARVAIIDFTDGWPPNHESMKFGFADLDRWTSAAGYTKIAEFDSVPGNFFRIYETGRKTASLSPGTYRTRPQRKGRAQSRP